jgi:CGNR zinc finger
MSRLASREPIHAELTGRLSLADLVWVANTGHGPAAHWFARPALDEPDHDHLTDASEAVRYLQEHEVAVPAGEPTARQLAGLAAVRTVVRDLAESRDGWQAGLERLLGRASFGVSRESDITARRSGWDGFVDDLTLPIVDLIRRNARLAVCGNSACRLVFVDDSRNQSRRWCDDAGCGNRVRVRRYREERRQSSRVGSGEG